MARVDRRDACPRETAPSHRCRPSRLRFVGGSRGRNDADNRPRWFHRVVASSATVRSIMLRPYAHKPSRIAPEMVANLLHGFGATANRAVLKEARTYDFTIAARAVMCPVFVVHGDKDLLVPPG